MVVGIALLLAVVDVSENAEAEPRVFVEDLALGHVVSDVLGDERVVLENLLEDLGHLLPARGSRVLRESLLTSGRELLQGPAHRVDLLDVSSTSLPNITTSV